MDNRNTHISSTLRTILGNASRFELFPSLQGPTEVQRDQNTPTLHKLAISMEHRSPVFHHHCSVSVSAPHLMSKWQETATGRKWNGKVWFSSLYHITYIAGLKCFLMMENNWTQGQLPLLWQVFKPHLQACSCSEPHFPIIGWWVMKPENNLLHLRMPLPARPDSISLPTNSLKYTTVVLG